MDKLTQLRTEQGELQGKIDALATAVGTGERAMTETEKTEFTGWKTRLAEIESEAKPLEELRNAAGKKVSVVHTAEKKETEEEKSIRSYSLMEVIKSRTKGEPLTGLEAEWGKEVSLRNAENGTSGGQYGIPSEIFAPKKRANLVVGTANVGGALVETDKPGLIEALNPYMIIDQLGVRKLSNLKGNLSLPKDVTAAEATFKGETSAASDQAGTFALIDLSPKRLPGYINYSHQMLIQPTIAIEPYVRERLLKSIANAVQNAFFVGTGTSSAPTGVLTTIIATGLAITTGRVIESAALMDWESIVDMETLIDESDALNGTLKFVGNSRMRGLLKSTTKGASTNGQYLWNDMDRATPVNGYAYLATNQIKNTAGTTLTNGTATPLILGNWDDSILANWGDIFFDTVNANAASGYYQLVVNTFWDVAVVRNESFSMIADVVTSPAYGS